MDPETDDKPDSQAPDTTLNNPEDKPGAVRQNFLDRFFKSDEEGGKIPKPSSEDDQPETESTTTSTTSTSTTSTSTTTAAYDPEKLAEDAADRAVKKAQEQAKPKAGDDDAPKAGDGEFKMSVKDTKKLRVLAKMEELDPGQYSGIAKKWETQVKAEADYKSKWIKENPGETYNPDDHEDFYNGLGELDWEDDDYDDARVELRLEEKSKAQEAKQSQEAAKQRLIPHQSQLRVQSMDTMLTELVGKDHGMLKDGQVVKDTVETFQEEDPISAQIVFNSVNQADNIVKEVFAVFNGMTNVKVNANGAIENPIHNLINAMTIELEDKIAGGPEEEKIRGGKRFAAVDEFAKMNPMDQGSRWVLTAKDVADYLVSKIVSQTKNELEEAGKRVMKSAKKRGAKVDDSEETPSGGAQETQGADSGSRAPAKSPTTGTSSHATGKPGKKPEENVSPLKRFSDRML